MEFQFYPLKFYFCHGKWTLMFFTFATCDRDVSLVSVAWGWDNVWLRVRIWDNA